jgi:Flp pilus assembly protein TadD
MSAISWFETTAAPTPFLDQQIALLMGGLERRPDEAAGRRRLIAMLGEAGRHDEAIAVQQAHLQRFPADSSAWLDHGASLIARGRFEEAQAALACVTAPELQAAALARRGLALARLRRFDEATPAFHAALALQPDEPIALRGLGSSLIRAGDGEALEAHCRAAMSRIGMPAWLVSHLSVALAQQGRDDALQALIDQDRLISVVDIEAPEGYASLADFNADLAEALPGRARFEAIGHDWDTPVRSALLARSGWHAPPGQDAASPCDVLERIFKDELQRYSDAGSVAPDHPHALNRPDGASLHVVSHILRTGGHIEPHIHPMAWVNAVYYVETPSAVTRSTTAAGWLHFGPPAYDDARLARAWPTMRIQPMAGRLVMFPSFLSHYVAPVEVDENRTTIAFEVSPVRQAGRAPAAQE